MGYLTNDKIWTFQKDGRIFEGTYEEECRTNVFAEAFLMPKNMYMDVLEKESEKSIINLKQIAGFFDVPVETAFRRGRFLRCLRG